MRSLRNNPSTCPAGSRKWLRRHLLPLVSAQTATRSRCQISQSDRWLGSTQSLTISFKNLTLPRKQSPPTDLLNLSPLPVSALQNAAFQNLFSFTHFNPLQTQAFHALYHMTSENVLLCSPTGSGKQSRVSLPYSRYEEITQKEKLRTLLL